MRYITKEEKITLLEVLITLVKLYGLDEVCNSMAAVKIVIERDRQRKELERGLRDLGER